MVAPDLWARNGAAVSRPGLCWSTHWAILSWRASGASSRVVAVSIKDRSAILTAGHKGTAYYFSSNTGRFITTTYHRRDYPQWWQDFYAERPQDAWLRSVWEPLRPEEAYAGSAPGGREQVTPEGNMGADFPHPIGSHQETPDRSYYREMARSPFGHDYLLQFVEAALAGERLGQRSATDLLVVAFSSHDYINHSFGPESIESHDDLLRLDETVSRLFEVLDAHVGLGRTAIVLTADHGFPRSPEWRIANSMDGGRVDVPLLMDGLQEHLSTEFTRTRGAVQWFAPGLFINYEEFEQRGFERADVEAAAARFLRNGEGIEAVFTRSRFESGAAADSELEVAGSARLASGELRRPHRHPKRRVVPAGSASRQRLDARVAPLVRSTGPAEYFLGLVSSRENIGNRSRFSILFRHWPESWRYAPRRRRKVGC